MRIHQLIVRNVLQHRLSSGLTLLNVALGALLLSSILLLRSATERSFLEPSRGYSLVVGPPGSRLELVLSTVFQMGQSPGLLAFEAFEELEQHPATELAVPYAVGDSFRGFRVVGTSEAFFAARFPQPAAEDTASKFGAGRPFRVDRQVLRRQLDAIASGNTGQATQEPSAALEAVLGSSVAAQLGIQLGDQLEPTHGVEGGGAAHEHQLLWTVVGILSATASPVDELVLINLDSFFRIADHRGGVIPETGKPGISAVLLFPKPGVHKALLLAQLSKRTQLQVADVDGEVRRLLRIVGNVDRIFFLIALLVVWIGVTSVSVGIYNTLAARQRDLAILRILGARRRTLFGMLMGEAALISALGGALGMALGHGLVAVMAGWIERSSGVRPGALGPLPEEGLALALLVLAGAVSGLLPALRAYRSDVVSHLAPVS
jgi:putative ABC transport system permease protein